MRDIRKLRDQHRQLITGFKGEPNIRKTFTSQHKAHSSTELVQLPAAANITPIQVNDITDPNFGKPIFMAGYSALDEGEPLG